MAVLGRLLISSAERLDLPDLLSIDSYAAGDWKYFLKGLVGDSKPYILKGFDIIDPQNAIGTQGCSIRVADSVVFCPGSSTGSFYHGLPEGNTEAAPLVPELRKNAVNYVYLTLNTFNTSTDTRAFWDPDKDGGAGGEFTQDVNTESVLEVSVNVSTGSFPQNTIPVAKVTVGAVVITSIEDARDLMFRLGSGGLVPNPYNEFSWRSSPSSLYKRAEPPSLMQSGGTNGFQGADKNIYSLKEWMDVVMTRIRELGGTTYWYEDTSTFGIVSSFLDSAATTFKSKGKWVHDPVTPGSLTWSEDINIKITADPRTYVIRGNDTKILSNEQVMYVPLVRKQDINDTNEAVSWTNGQPYVNTIGGAVGLFKNLKKGDWIRKINDSSDKWLRVEEFYAEIGQPTTALPSVAKSIKLSANYAGTTGYERAKYDRGEYLSSDVVVSDRNDINIYNAGGNFHWLAMRSDTIQNIGGITKETLTLSITEHDGYTGKVTSALAHNLIDGDRVTIEGTANFDGTYVVEVESTTVFYINNSNGPYANDSGTGHYAVVTTASRSSVDGFLEESNRHNFKTDDTVVVASTTGYNGSYKISVRSDTTFNIPIGSSATTQPAGGTVTLPRILVRSEGSVYQLIQGESVDIGGSPADNIRQYVGMESLSQTTPNYTVPVSYNTLDGMANYNSSTADNLTDRVSKLTSMMANKSHDKTIKYLPYGINTITNTTSGAYQQITFNPPGGTLTLVTPGSTGDATIGLPDSSPGIQLAVNQVAYVSIDRNSTTLPSIVISNTSDMPVDENIFVIAERLSTTDVYIWEGSIVAVGSIPGPGYLNTVIRQNQTLKLVEGGTWSWNSGTGAVSWSATAYIQIPGLANTVNQIAAGSATLTSGQVAYVDINRVSPGGTLTVNVASSASLATTTDRFIIARREGNDVIVGLHSMRLINGESKKLYAGTSDQTLTYTGQPDAADSSPNYSSATVVSQGSDLTTAIGSIDAKLNTSSYDESSYSASTITAGTTITIPNSKTFVSSLAKDVNVIVNGIQREVTRDFTVVGGGPTYNQIQFIYDLPPDSVIRFKKTLFV